MPSEQRVPGADQRFPKAHRVRLRTDFKSAQASGRRVHARHFVMLLRTRDGVGPPRLGITTSRRVGNSVVRNRVRRLVREVFRRDRGSFPEGTDCVVIVRDRVPALDYEAVRREILAALERDGARAAKGSSRR